MIKRLFDMSIGEFSNKLLNGVAVGIVIGLIPNAILGELFKALQETHPIFSELSTVISAAQSSVPLLIGCLVGVQFLFTPIEIATLGATLFVSSGVIKFGMIDNVLTMQLKGIGDLVNIILVSFIATIVIRMLRGKLGSLSMILIPTIVVTFVGWLGYAMLPYVSKVSIFLGYIIQHFTTLQPLFMSIFLSISFAIMIVSPMSTVAIAIAIGLSGLASGAANVGIATCAMTIIVGSVKAKNKLGTSLAVFFGSMKLFIPNWMKHPIMNVPIILNAILGGIIAYIFNIQGTSYSAGFGFSGLVGPINAYQFMEQSPSMRIAILFLVYFVLTTLGALFVDYILVRIIKLYKHSIFEFSN